MSAAEGNSPKLVSRFLSDALLLRRKIDQKVTFDRIFPDRDGTLHVLLRNMRIGSSEGNTWMKVWLGLVNKSDDYKLDLSDFRKHFRLDSSIWIDRVFDIINYSLSGHASFGEFLAFCSSYILIDKKNTIELCFRLLSRRGTNFMKEFSVLDVEDVENYLSEQYIIGRAGKLKKNAQDVLSGIEACAELHDNDGAILFGDFLKFCEVNPVFVRFTHRIQNHIRHCLFGMPYWIERTRRVKAVGIGGISLLISGSANLESERFMMVQLFDPEWEAERQEKLANNQKISTVNRSFEKIIEDLPKAARFPDLSSSSEAPPYAEKENLSKSIFGGRQPDLHDNGFLVTTKISSAAFGLDFPEAEIVRGKRKAAAMQKIKALQNISKGGILGFAKDLSRATIKDPQSPFSLLTNIPITPFDAQQISPVEGSINGNVIEGTEPPVRAAGSRGGTRPGTAGDKDGVEVGDLCVLHPLVYATIKAEDEEEREARLEGSFEKYLQSCSDKRHHTRNVLHADRTHFLPVILAAAMNDYA